MDPHPGLVSHMLKKKPFHFIYDDEMMLIADSADMVLCCIGALSGDSLEIKGNNDVQADKHSVQFLFP